MFGLMSACAFADTAQTVEARMPTLATMRARFMIDLALDDGWRGTLNGRKRGRFATCGVKFPSTGHVILSCFVCSSLLASRLTGLAGARMNNQAATPKGNAYILWKGAPNLRKRSPHRGVACSRTCWRRVQ